MLTNCSAQWGMGIVDCVGLYNCLLLQLIESGPLVRIVFPVLFVSVCSCWDLYTPQLMTAFHLWPSEFIFMRWFPIIGPIYYLLGAEPQFSWVRTINLVQGSSCREDEVQLWVSLSAGGGPVTRCSDPWSRGQVASVGTAHWNYSWTLGALSFHSHA